MGLDPAVAPMPTDPSSPYPQPPQARAQSRPRPSLVAQSSLRITQQRLGLISAPSGGIRTAKVGPGIGDVGSLGTSDSGSGSGDPATDHTNSEPEVGFLRLPRPPGHAIQEARGDISRWLQRMSMAAGSLHNAKTVERELDDTGADDPELIGRAADWLS